MNLEKINEILNKNKNQRSHNKALKEIGEEFNVEKDLVILINRVKVSRNMVKNIPAFNLCFTYNYEFSSLLKENYQGMFNYDKCWRAVYDNENDFIEFLKNNFELIIDLDEREIIKNSLDKKENKISTYKLMPYYLKVDVLKIIEEFNFIKNKDIVEKVSIYDGDKFIKTENDIFYTKSPFALLRFTGDKFAPRYVVYSVLAEEIEDIAFNNDSKKTSSFIARFSDPIKTKDQPIIIYELPQELQETEELKKQYFGFYEYKNDVIEIEKKLKNIKISPIASDYIFLNERFYGGDIDHTDILAYVITSDFPIQYLDKISKHFNYFRGYPIILARNKINKDNFKAIAIHELTHHLIENDNEDSHNINFSITNDFLQIYLNNKLHDESSLKTYNNIIIDEQKYINLIKNRINKIKQILGIKDIEKIVNILKIEILKIIEQENS